MARPREPPYPWATKLAIDELRVETNHALHAPSCTNLDVMPFALSATPAAIVSNKWPDLHVSSWLIFDSAEAFAISQSSWLTFLPWLNLSKASRYVCLKANTVEPSSFSPRILNGIWIGRLVLRQPNARTTWSVNGPVRRYFWPAEGS